MSDFEDTEEFDAFFHENNPSLLASQQYYSSNHKDVLLAHHFEGFDNYFVENQTFHISFVECKLKSHGLNQNRRGNLKPEDLRELMNGPEVEMPKSQIAKKGKMKLFEKIKNNKESQRVMVEKQIHKIDRQIINFDRGKDKHYRWSNQVQMLEEEKEQHFSSKESESISLRNLSVEDVQNMMVNSKILPEQNIFCQKNNSSSSKSSLIRRSRLSCLQLRYPCYLKKFQSLFIIRCQLMFKKYYKIEKQLLNTKIQFHNTQAKLKKYVDDKITIVIDIENSFLVRVHPNILNLDENKYMFVGCSCQEVLCQCEVQQYQIRPYTFEFLRAISPFFELIVYSKYPRAILEEIVDKLETVLNQPKDLKENYFHFILHDEFFVQGGDYWFENMALLSLNRPINSVILLSANPIRLVSAQSQGYLVVPVVPLETYTKRDFQLHLVENYILQIRNSHEATERVRQSFIYLMDNTSLSQIQALTNFF